MKINLQFTRIYEINPTSNTRNYYLIYWFCFFIISFCVGLYTSCDYQSSIYVKGSCNTILLMAGQTYLMKSNEDVLIYIIPERDLIWDGRNGLKYSCYSNINIIKTTYFSDLMAETNFLGNFICNEIPWLKLSSVNIDNSPPWLKNIIIEDYNQIVENSTGPFTVQYEIKHNIKKISNIINTYEVIFNTNILETLSNYTEAINNLDVAVSYQCKSCYNKIKSFDFQSFIRLIITMGSILSIGTFIANKIIINLFKYKNHGINLDISEDKLQSRLL